MPSIYKFIDHLFDSSYIHDNIIDFGTYTRKKFTDQRLVGYYNKKKPYGLASELKSIGPSQKKKNDYNFSYFSFIYNIFMAVLVGLLYIMVFDAVSVTCDERNKSSIVRRFYFPSIHYQPYHEFAHG